MEECIFWYLSKGTLLDKINTSIGIVIIFRFLYETLNITTIQIKNTQLYTHIIGDSCYGHFRIILLKMKEEIFIIDISEKIRIHHKNGIIIECIYKLNATNSTKELGFPECTHLHSITSSGKMILQLLCKIVYSHIYMLYTI